MLECPHGMVAIFPRDKSGSALYDLDLEITHHHPCHSLLVTLIPALNQWGWGLYKGVKTKSQDLRGHLEDGYYNVTQS